MRSQTLMLMMPRFTIAELIRITNNFSTIYKIGDGNLHSGTFYKVVLSDGTLLAIWHPSPHGNIFFQNIRAQIESLSIRRTHPNLLQIVGDCETPSDCFLIYPYMSNGTIRSQLYKVDHRKLALTFKIRKHIALGVAKGLVYLHEKCSPKIVHHNVNSGTILLDDEYEALVPDFEFCKVIDSMPTRIVQGIIGYIAPEYYSNGVVSVKNDVYSYGILLMELITARDPRWGVKDCSEHEGVVNLVDWVKKLAKDNKVESIVDSNFKEYNVIDIKNLLQVVLSCIQSSPSARPKMSEVVSMLQRNNLD